MTRRLPTRIQRTRAKGWRMPEGALYVGRPSRWGNPFRVGPAVYYQVPAGPGASIVTDPTRVVEVYRRWLTGGIWDVEIRSYPHVKVPEPPTSDQIRAALAGRDLACWCPLDQPCHTDVLLELANGRAD